VEIDVGQLPFHGLNRKELDARMSWQGELRHRDRDPNDWLRCIDDGGAAKGEGQGKDCDEEVGFESSWSANRTMAPTTTNSAPVLAPTTIATLPDPTSTDISNIPCLASNAPSPWLQTSHNPSAQAAGPRVSVQNEHQLEAFAWPFPHIACEIDDHTYVPVQVEAIGPSTLCVPLPNLQTPTNLLVQAHALPVLDLSATLPLFDMPTESSEGDFVPESTADASMTMDFDQISTEPPDPSVLPEPSVDQSAAIRLKQAFVFREIHSLHALEVLQVRVFNVIHME